jgi:nitrogen fixation-related uncharacterized protein
MEYLNYLIGFGIFLTLLTISYFTWGYYLNRKQKDKENDDVSNSPEFDFRSLLDKSKDRDYLHGKTDKYTWSQNENEIEMIIPVASDITRKHISCSINPDKIAISIKGQVECIIEGELYASVIPEECNWQLGKIFSILHISTLALTSLNIRWRRGRSASLAYFI